MKAFVLVHGSWHGAWCWHKLVPRLRDAGHRVITPELPAHGIDSTDALTVTFDDYVDSVGEVIKQSSEDIVLVGHSMGGHTVTQAAEEYAAALSDLVYLSAFLPADGQSPAAFDIGEYGSFAPEYMVPEEEDGVVSFLTEGARETFYHDCTDEDVALGQSLLRPEPIQPRQAPVSLSIAGYGSLPRTYIECTDDRAIPISLQQEMYEMVPCDSIYSLDTSHSPFFSAPDELTEVLLDVAKD